MPDVATATRFVTLTLGHLTREYPNKLDHVITGAQDLESPATLHPIFYGSYDWHSCVHGWWQVMRLARQVPACAGPVEALAAAMLVPEKAAGELAYLARPASAGFERPYGWGWLLALHGELALRPDRPWAAAIEPLARVFADRLRSYLPRLVYPVRHGLHGNTAFALILAHEWAQGHDPDLATLIATRARDWFADDRDARPFEPSGEDFLSPTLCEAVLMARVLDAGAFATWFDAFLPDPLGIAALVTPATVTDRRDGRLAHLDGLNLSRAWCWSLLARAMGDTAMEDVARLHRTAALPHLADDYMGEHWLATFALLALDAAPGVERAGDAP